MTDAVTQFFAAWSDTDTKAQADRIAGAVSPDVRYCDPRTPEPLIGPDAISGYVAQFTEMAPGAVADPVDITSRDGVLRVTVAFRMADGAQQMGQYFIEADAAGRLSRLVGFVGTGT